MEEADSKKILKFGDAIQDCIAFLLNGWPTEWRSSERLANECHRALALFDELIQVFPNTIVTCVSEQVDRFTFFVLKGFVCILIVSFTL